MNRIALAALLVVLCSPAPVAGQPVDIATGQPARLRRPGSASPPSAEAQAASRQAIRSLLENHKEFAAFESLEASRFLADLAHRTNDDPTARYVLMHMAYDRAVQAGNDLLALAIIDELARSHRIDALAMHFAVFTRSIERSTEGARSNETYQLAWAFRLVESALLVDRIDLAEDVMTLASPIAKRSNDQLLKDDGVRWAALVQEWSAPAAEAQRAALRVVQDPDDANAYAALGRYLSLTKGDWKNGLWRLARGSDQALRLAAKAERAAGGDPHALIAAADQWRELADDYTGIARRRLILHADDLYRRVYPDVTGLTRLAVDQKLLRPPFVVFDSLDPPSEEWVVEHLRFRGTRGLNGSGRWANIEYKNGRATLFANQAGFIETRERFPPPGVDHYQIVAELWSDKLPGTALEFGGHRMHFGKEKGIHLAGGWAPNVIYPITNDYFHYLIDVRSDGVSFILNGVFLGDMNTTKPARGPIVLRGWKGHVRCRRLVVWSMDREELPPLPTLPEYLGNRPFTIYVGTNESATDVNATSDALEFGSGGFGNH